MTEIVQYKLIVTNRKYDEYEIVNVKTMTNSDSNQCEFHPLKEKLFNHDIFTLEGTYCKLQHSTVKSATYIPGVLVLKNDRRFGKYKNRFLYKCIPDDKRLPIFLIPYTVKK